MAIEQAIPQDIPERKELKRGKDKYVRVPITNAMKPIAIALIARGGIEYEEMSDILKREYKVDLAPEDFKRLANSNITLIANMRRQIRKAAEVDAAKMLKKVDSILNRSLDRTLRDMETLESTDALFSNGEIDDDQYRQMTEKIKIMPLNEVLKVADYLNPKPNVAQVAHSPLPIANSNQAAPTEQNELTDSIAAALKAGNAVELQRIMYTKKDTNDTEA